MPFKYLVCEFANTKALLCAVDHIMILAENYTSNLELTTQRLFMSFELFAWFAPLASLASFAPLASFTSLALFELFALLTKPPQSNVK